jgi:hypothetical protein
LARNIGVDAPGNLQVFKNWEERLSLHARYASSNTFIHVPTGITRSVRMIASVVKRLANLGSCSSRMRVLQCPSLLRININPSFDHFSKTETSRSVCTSTGTSSESC